MSDPPQVNLLPETEQEVEYRKTARFTCNVSGNPTPSISWHFLNTTIETSLKYEINTTGTASILTVKSLTRADSGSYECRAVSSNGSDSKTSNLTVLSK